MCGAAVFADPSVWSHATSSRQDLEYTAALTRWQLGKCPLYSILHDTKTKWSGTCELATLTCPVPCDGRRREGLSDTGSKYYSQVFYEAVRRGEDVALVDHCAPAQEISCVGESV